MAGPDSETASGRKAFHDRLKMWVRSSLRMP